MNWLHCSLPDFSDEEYTRAYDALSPSRKQRIDRYKQQSDRLRSLAGELLLRELLRDSFGITDAVIESAPNGRPLLPNNEIFISIAHCNHMIVCAADDQPVGIDIEQIRPVNLSMARHVCVEDEAIYLFGKEPTQADYCLCEDPDMLHRFFEIWTAKEAYFKKMGTGITNLKSVNVLPLPRQLHHLDDYLVQIM